MTKRLDEIDNKINALVDDMGDSQGIDLAQAHDFYMSQGWCPSSTKQQICQMHTSYAKKGRNHLSASYEQDIIGLPEHP